MKSAALDSVLAAQLRRPGGVQPTPRSPIQEKLLQRLRSPRTLAAGLALSVLSCGAVTCDAYLEPNALDAGRILPFELGEGTTCINMRDLSAVYLADSTNCRLLTAERDPVTQRATLLTVHHSGAASLTLMTLVSQDGRAHTFELSVK